MARAHAADACVQSDSIKGLAQSLAKPAYHRLLVAEPALRRAVPTLIIAFLATICIGAIVQLNDQSRQQQNVMRHDIAALADILAERLDHDLDDPRVLAALRSVKATIRQTDAAAVRAAVRHWLAGAKAGYDVEALPEQAKPPS